MIIGGRKWKTRKKIIPSPVPSYESLVSVKENTNRKSKKRRKKERKKERWTLLMLRIMLKYYPNN